MLVKAEEMLRRGFQVDLLLVDERNDLSGNVPDGVRVFNFGAARLRYAVTAISQYLRQEKPDAMHAAMWPLTSIAIISRILARSKTRLVVSDHNPLMLSAAEFGPLYRLGMRICVRVTYPFADARLTVSRGIAEGIASMSGLSRNDFSVVNNFAPVLIEEDGEGELPTEAWGLTGGYRILTVGRLKQVKNHRLLLDSLSKLLPQEDVRLVILGTGELQQELQQYIDENGLSDRAFLPGHVDDPNPYYRAADLFVLSSDYEGFGNVLLEALANGLPIVSTDCPSGPREILGDGKYGRLVEPRNANALAAAMLEAIHSSHDGSLLRSRTFDFSMERVVDQYLDLMLPDWREGRVI